MNKINKIYSNSKKVIIDDSTKLVIMSDCHRGAGNNYDNFEKNKHLYESSLIYYYNRGYAYIELGDGDEMWEVDDYKDIVNEHIHTFKVLKKFYDANRLIMIYGNHDIYKRYKNILEKNFYTYYNSITKEEEKLFPDLNVYESIVLVYKNKEILMIHGHQASFLNSNLWRVSCFLVKHIWRHLEHLGIKDPTSAAKKYKETKKIEKRLKKWSISNNKMIIAGHTHRPIFPEVGDSLYFNDGSCIHPNGITCIEIENGNITLVKWSYELKNGNLLMAHRTEVQGKTRIIDFFDKSYH